MYWRDHLEPSLYQGAWFSPGLQTSVPHFPTLGSQFAIPDLLLLTWHWILHLDWPTILLFLTLGPVWIPFIFDLALVVWFKFLVFLPLFCSLIWCCMVLSELSQSVRFFDGLPVLIIKLLSYEDKKGWNRLSRPPGPLAVAIHISRNSVKRLCEKF